ncbi:MAG TPA: hypothetical protein VG602_08350 [Actinomycetota bacterium]|nr:hypothetical protein [Actinomycetota bacterium]
MTEKDPRPGASRDHESDEAKATEDMPDEAKHRSGKNTHKSGEEQEAEEKATEDIQDAFE